MNENEYDDWLKDWHESNEALEAEIAENCRAWVRTALKDCGETIEARLCEAKDEGKLVCICAKEDAARLLETMKQIPEGQNAAVIGRVIEDAAGRVVMRTALGGRRILQKLAGAQLPRIC